jgi:hypothetical protein
MKKNEKNLAKTKKADAKVDAKAKVTLTPKASVAPVAESKGPDRPEMPANFCLTKKEWDSDATGFDATSNQCKACGKDFPDTCKVCKTRAEFLASKAKEAKVRKAGGLRKTSSTSGIPPQTKIIDDGLLAKLPKSEIVANLATAHYGGNGEANIALATKRFDRHLKSIKDGSYVRAATVANCIAYLTAKTAKAEQAPAKASAKATSSKKK